MIRKIINKIKSLNMDITPWMDNSLHSIKEKHYKNRKVIIIIEKNKLDDYIGKFMIMKYKKELVIGDEDIEWQYKPHMTYKTDIVKHMTEKNSNLMKKKMEDLFQEVFLEKKIKLKFM